MQDYIIQLLAMISYGIIITVFNVLKHFFSTADIKPKRRMIFKLLLFIIYLVALITFIYNVFNINNWNLLKMLMCIVSFCLSGYILFLFFQLFNYELKQIK